MRILALLLAAALNTTAYMPNPIGGTPNHRSDYAAIQFLANQNIAAGLTNAAGKIWITADSNPMNAIQGAVAAWNGVTTSAAHFLPVQPTPLTYNSQDGKHVIAFVDDGYTESFSAGVIAQTVGASYADGTIVDTDILFSPTVAFSTTQASGTYDLQSVLTHELGHSLGANHTNILSGTMFWATLTQDAHQQTLSADEAAFVSSLYPAAGGNGYGTISGVATVAGAPLLGGAITAVTPDNGITVGGFSSTTDGSFSFQAPPGNYFVYVEPAGGLNLYVSTGPPPTTLFNTFQSAFAGGNAQPTFLQVQAGATTTASMDARAGVTPIKTPFCAIGIAGGLGDFQGTLTSASLTISSGQSVDFLFTNPITGAVSESNIQIIGPATLRAGSLRRDSISLTDGTAIYRFTLDLPPLSSNTSATIVFKNGTDILTRSGVLNLTRPQSVNAGSFLGGPVAPGEILSFFGSKLGPASPATNGGFDSNGQLPTTLGGNTVTFDGTQAPLFYVSNNQINLQVPYEISGKASTLMTITYADPANPGSGSTVATTTLTVAKSAPGIFVVTNADGSANGPNSPGAVGAVLVVYGTGAGVTSGLIRTGAAAPANSITTATATIGGIPVTPGYAGLTPGSVGLTQVNLVIPPGTPSGNTVPLQFSMNGVATQTVNISVR